MYKIWGYITVFERNSRMLSRPNKVGFTKFYEQVEIGAFRKSIQSGKDIPLVLNHKDVLASTKAGTLKLVEDFIGLRFEAAIEDVALIRDIQTGEIENCSFEFKPLQEYIKGTENGIPIRVLKCVELSHVSLIKKPSEAAYLGSSVKYCGR